jgi:hypothetical protein
MQRQVAAMNERIERVNALVSGLHLPAVDLERLYAKKNNLTPLESIEVFLAEQQRLRTEKQNLIHRKRANLPAEKTLETFDFGFQRSVSRELTLRLSDMTWVTQTVIRNRTREAAHPCAGFSSFSFVEYFVYVLLTFLSTNIIYFDYRNWYNSLIGGSKK